MRYGAAIVVVVGMSLISCNRAERRAPIDRAQMTDLLVDLHLAQARAVVEGRSPEAQVDSVLELRRVTRDHFEAALSYYAERPEAYVSIMDSVIDLMRVRRPAADVEGQDPLYNRVFGSAFRDTLAELRGTGEEPGPNSSE